MPDIESCKRSQKKSIELPPRGWFKKRWRRLRRSVKKRWRRARRSVRKRWRRVRRSVKRRWNRVRRGVKKFGRRIGRGIRRIGRRIRGWFRGIRGFFRNIKMFFRRLKSGMRKVRYFWRMFKAVRGYVRRYRAAPDRMLLTKLDTDDEALSDKSLFKEDEL